MSYPTSCGTDGKITEISLACMNDLWKAPPNNCTTSLAATSDPKAFTLVGSTPELLPFSTYGQTLSQVSYNIGVAQNSEVLCTSGTYLSPSAAGNSINQILISYNAELNGLVAQYSYLYNQYTTLSKSPPSDNSNNISAMTAYNSMVTSIKADIDTLYPKILDLSKTINTNLNLASTAKTINETSIQNNVTKLMNKIDAMNKAFTNLNIEANKPTELNGDYEVAQLTTKSSFMKHLLYIFFALLIAGCLIFINISPTEGKLDMFILGLGVVILVYYIYDYLQKYKK